MGCIEFANTTCNTTSNGSIAELLRKIEKMQKEAIKANELGNCNTCIIAPMFNTKPIAVYLCNTPLTAVIDDENVANRFRVEEVKGDVVILRLLMKNGQELGCTQYTITVKISCICCIQCFEPITCPINCA